MACGDAARHEARLTAASRLSFPSASSHGVLVFYADASREFIKGTDRASSTSGWGAWTVLGDTFYYIYGRWSDWECQHFSINILEAATQKFATRAFVQKAEQNGMHISHVHGFVDNSTAEMVMEKGRTQSDGLNSINLERLEFIRSRGIHMKTSRVPSTENDVADDLSRGAIEEALRFPQECHLLLELIEHDELEDDVLDLSATPFTWA